jgi:hypothetical protein
MSSKFHIVGALHFLLNLKTSIPKALKRALCQCSLYTISPQRSKEANTNDEAPAAAAHTKARASKQTQADFSDSTLRSGTKKGDKFVCATVWLFSSGK